MSEMLKAVAFAMNIGDEFEIGGNKVRVLRKYNVKKYGVAFDLEILNPMLDNQSRISLTRPNILSLDIFKKS